MPFRWMLALALALGLPGLSWAQTPWPPPEYLQAIPEKLKATTHALDTTGEPKVHMPSGDHTWDRAGYAPGCVHNHATYTNYEHGFQGGWVGGSTPFAHRGGAAPAAYGDGTWGWDLVGHRKYHHIFMYFRHDAPHQPRGGTYDPNAGPHVPDIFAYRPLVQIRERRKEAEEEAEKEAEKHGEHGEKEHGEKEHGEKEHGEKGHEAEKHGAEKHGEHPPEHGTPPK